jgi:predicted MFS family arabinose efflux permease
MTAISPPAATPFHVPALDRAQSLSILAGASIMLSLAMGMRQSLGLFMQPMTTGTGISPADFALALAVQNIVWGATQPFAGALVDRYGTRWVSIAGVALYAAGLLLTAFARDALLLGIGAGVMIGVALSCTTSGVAAKIAARVVRPQRRSLAFGIVSGAGSIGSVLAAPLAEGVIGAAGWQIAVLAFVALAAAMLPAAIMGSRSDRLSSAAPGEATLTLRGALDEARRHGGYVVMAIAFFVCGLQLTFLVTHLPTFLALCGLDPMVGAQALAVIGLFNIAGSWLFGWAGDRYPKHLLLGAIYLLRSAFIAAYFMLPVSPASTLLFAAAMGLLWLGVIPLVNGLVAQIFGIRFLGTLTGIAFFSHQVGAFLGAWGGGVIYERLGSYDAAWKIAVLIGVIAAGMQMLMSTRPLARLATA